MTLYPDGIDSTLQLPTILGSDGYIVAINDLRDAVLAIENELGITPHGAYSDTVTRLAILESRVGPGATITGGSIDINDANLAGTLTIAKGGTALTATGALHTVMTSAGGTIFYKLLDNNNIDSAAAIVVSKLAAGTNTNILTTTGGIPVWAAPAVQFTTPTGTGFVSVTSGVLDAASIKVNLASSTYVTGILAAANGGTGLSALGTGVATFLGTPSSANLATAIADATGNGVFVLATSPVIASPSISTPSISGTIVHQGTRLRVLQQIDEVQTVDDTITTLSSFIMVDETLCAFDVIVTAVLQGAATDGGRWKRSVAYSRTAAGIPLIVGTLETVGLDQKISGGLDVNIDDNGVDTIRVRVTGIAATNFNWGCELRVQESLTTV